MTPTPARKKQPSAPPDLEGEKKAILGRIRELRAARQQLDADDLAVIAAGRAKGVTWSAMAEEFGTTASWLCQYYRPKLNVSVTVQPSPDQPTGWRERPRRGRGRTQS